MCFPAFQFKPRTNRHFSSNLVRVESGNVNCNERYENGDEMKIQSIDGVARDYFNVHYTCSVKRHISCVIISLVLFRFVNSVV